MKYLLACGVLLSVLGSAGPVIAKDLPPTDKQASRGAPSSHDAATVLLITDETLARAWQPFADWKTATCRRTKTLTVSQISKAYPANVVQESIRLCVRDHIDHHKTQWVVLGGDCTPEGGLVPGGHVTVHRQEPQGIPTDIVYLSPTNWDADGDGILGEWPDDREAITYPDGSVGLGRIPVRTAEDVAAFTEKVIAYESQYPDSDFASRMLYTCTVEGAYPKVRKSWDRYLSNSWSGQAERFFLNESPWDETDPPGRYELNAGHLVELINHQQIGKLHIHGHGFLPAWVLENSAFTSRHVARLRNSAAYPLITTVSCFTGQYDAKQDPSIVESMLRRPRGGSVAVVAPVRTGKPHFSDPRDLRLMVTQGKLDGTTMTMTRYWLHGLGNGQTTGHAIMKAKADMAEDAHKSPSYHLCVCELNLLGDPALDMRALPPHRPEIALPESIAKGQQTITVLTDTPGCSVCLWNKDSHQTTKANESGSATFELATPAIGEISIGVWGENLNAVVKRISCEG